MTWRLWKYAHVRPGNVYALGFGGAMRVLDVRTVRVRDLAQRDADEAGVEDIAALCRLVAAHTGAEIGPDTELYRVEFEYLPEAPPRPRPPFEEVQRRLARLDAASASGPWTMQALRLIETQPGIVARVLAAQAGVPRLDFKANVRKLKALGLTESLMVGYELSDHGQAYLDWLAAREGE